MTQMGPADPDSDRLQSPVILSVVIPAFNEENGILAFHDRLREAVKPLAVQLEALYVDDGSTDGTHEKLTTLQASDPSVGYLRFSRNFGKETAVTAGLNHARGAVVIVIDADLQDPPELIPEMLDAWKRGADIVNMRRISRAGETLLKKMTSHLFYRVMNKLSEVPIPVDVGDFRLLSRRAVDALNRMPERNRFMKGLFAWIGFRQETLPYHREPRAAGNSKWPYWRLWNLAVEGVTGFSTAPLKLALYFGLASSLGAFCALVYFLIKTLLIGDPVPGFPATIVTVLFLGGVQIASIGILGEYIARIFIESKGRPLYLVDTYKPAEL
jgi:glycosyltransferase involved in cell wall biosynthesis